MQVVLENRQKTPIGTEVIEANARTILNALGYPEAELSIVLVDDPTIAEMNREYLGRTGPTNVIAFPMQEGDYAAVNPNLLGDVVLSVDTVEVQAREGGFSVPEMLDFFLIHGILHLIGYDHEISAEESDRMEARTWELWQTLGHRLEDEPGPV